MSALDQIAHAQGRRDEVPNQELARKLASRRDREGVREIAQNLWSKDKNIQADCIKVLYEVGYLDPALIAPYVDDFLKLIKCKILEFKIWLGNKKTTTNFIVFCSFPHCS